MRLCLELWQHLRDSRGGAPCWKGEEAQLSSFLGSCLGLCSTRVRVPPDPVVAQDVCMGMRFTQAPSRSKGMREDKMLPPPKL